MEKHITDEKTGIGYTLHRDYYIPDITLPPQEKYPPLGKYGMLRETYLKEHRRGTYALLQMDGELRSHLRDVDEQANEILEQTVKSLAEKEKCDESLKRAEPMKWVGLMNNYRSAAEEIIFRELIYV